MADQRGRCTNVEFCTVAVSQKAIAVPPLEPFVCFRCGEPLQGVEERRSRPRKLVAFGLQAAVLVAAAGTIGWRVYGSRGEAPAVAAAAAPSSPGQMIVSGPSFTATVPPVVAAPAAIAAPAAPAIVAAPAAVAAPAVPVPAEVPVSLAMATPAPSPRAPAPAVLLRIAAPVALGTGLERRLASGYLSLIGDTGITTEAAGADLDVIGLQAGAREAIRIVPAASQAAFTALLRGTVDAALTLRRVTPAETARLASIGDMASTASEHVVGVQGVAVVVSPANRIPSLTTLQVRDLLTGRVTDWADVGGQAGPVRVHVLDGQEGRVDVPQDLVLAGTPVVGSAQRDATESALASAVAADRGGVGLVVAASAGGARVVPLAETGAVPLMPTDLAVATEDYPLTRRVYFYHGRNAGTGYVRRFSDYVASPTGQAAVEAAGFVALSLRTEEVVVPEAASDRYKQFVTGSSRVSVDFRFQPGSVELDGRGVRDLQRLVAFVKARRVSPGRLMLAAFADNSGTPAVNQLTSQRRADAVAAALARQGMQVGKVAGFGAEYPVADNATAAGRERNRRVEVYLAP